jgi:hypothetical protein
MFRPWSKCQYIQNQTLANNNFITTIKIKRTRSIQLRNEKLRVMLLAVDFYHLVSYLCVKMWIRKHDIEINSKTNEVYDWNVEINHKRESDYLIKSKWKVNVFNLQSVCLVFFVNGFRRTFYIQFNLRNMLRIKTWTKLHLRFSKSYCRFSNKLWHKMPIIFNIREYSI